MPACRLAHQEDEKGAPFASLPGPSVRSARWIRLKAYRPSSPTFFIGDPEASGLSSPSHPSRPSPTTKSGFPITNVGNDGFGIGDPEASGLSSPSHPSRPSPTTKSGFPMTHVGNDGFGIGENVGNDGFGRGGALVIFFHINDKRQES